MNELQRLTKVAEAAVAQSDTRKAEARKKAKQAIYDETEKFVAKIIFLQEEAKKNI